MSKNLTCDHCGTSKAIPTNKAYDEFPKGWFTVIARDPFGPDDEKDYCSPECVSAAMEKVPALV